MTEDRSKLEQFKELAELEPDDPLVHYGLGTEHLKLGELAEAVSAFRRTLELKPDYSAAYRELGKALDKLGDRQAARQAYEKGKQVAQEKGDLQTVREIEIFLKRLGSP
jgi:Flp pilus assembly protein TadD